jgi:hypothetical protein
MAMQFCRHAITVRWEYRMFDHMPFSVAPHGRLLIEPQGSSPKAICIVRRNLVATYRAERRRS